jgi:glyoxalase family protein
MEIGGIHHVTAVSGDARINLEFYTQVLGLRLVKKTVNQDMVEAYHLFYADEIGSPGTDMTFFEWPLAPEHRKGAGDVAATVFVVPDRAALDWWIQRFEQFGVSHGEIEEWTGRPTLAFTDPEGQRLELVVGQRGGVKPWAKSPVPERYAIHGFGAVKLIVPSLDRSAHVLTELMGFRKAGEYQSPDDTRRIVVLETGEGGLGTEVHLEEVRTGGHAHVGIGGVHHVAFRTPNDEEIQEWQHRLTHAGMAVTPVIDRYYFRSIYFREPGGVLYEIATDGPGFASDEDPEHLGERLALPPFLEDRRAEIEAQLHPIELVPQA